MDRYSKAKIYKIVDNTTGQVYIGSTCVDTLAVRLARHKCKYRRYLDGHVGDYLTSFEVLKNGDYTIVLLEEYPCQTKDQLFARERYYIENVTCVNKNIPNRSEKEYREANKEILNAKSKERYAQNKDNILEQCKEYYQENREYIKQRVRAYYNNNLDKCKAQRKKYREENKEKLNEHTREYYQDNKETLNEKRNVSLVCDCGISHTLRNKARHLKSQKHLEYCKQIEPTNNELIDNN
jgi:hypothetical protein